MTMRPLVPALLAAALAAPVTAEPLGVGATLPALTLEDQHGESHTLDASVRLVIFTREMDAGDVVKEVLAERGGEVLAERSAVYVADVHGMPGLIRRLFALPAMRRRPYAMWLDTEGDATADFPSVDGKPTLLFVEALQVKDVQHPADAAALRAALGLPAEEPAE